MKYFHSLNKFIVILVSKLFNKINKVNLSNHKNKNNKKDCLHNLLFQIIQIKNKFNAFSKKDIKPVIID